MGVLTIRRLGDTILNEQAASVGKIDREIKRLLDDMALTMHHAKGVGLAAPGRAFTTHYYRQWQRRVN